MVGTYRELLAACDRIGFHVGLELRGAGKLVPGRPEAREYRRVLKVRSRCRGTVLASASGHPGEPLDELARAVVFRLEDAGVPLHP